MSVRDVIIIGAGPSGLSAAIAAKKRGLDYQVVEQGVLVNSIFRFPPQMVFFTTPELLEIGGLPFVSPYDKPTRAEALRYYRKVVDAYDLQICTRRKCWRSTERKTGGRRSSRSRPGPTKACAASRLARFVVVAIGYYDHLSGSAFPARISRTCITITARPTPTTVSASLSSAAGIQRRRRRSSCSAPARTSRSCIAAIELKRTIKYWVRPDIENRIKEGSIAAHLGTASRRFGPRRSSSILEATLGNTDAGLPAPADSFAAVAGSESTSVVEPSRLQQVTKRFRPTRSFC